MDDVVDPWTEIVVVGGMGDGGHGADFSQGSEEFGGGPAHIAVRCQQDHLRAPARRDGGHVGENAVDVGSSGVPDRDPR